MRVSDSCTLSRSVEERRSLSGKSFISWLYLCTVPIVSLEYNNKSEKERPTEIRGILQPGISNKTDSGMEPLCIPQCIHDHPHLLAPQLRLYPLQCPLKTQPEVDLLRCRAGGNVSRELGHRLDGFDPCVDVRVERVEERAVGEEL